MGKRKRSTTHQSRFDPPVKLFSNLNFSKPTLLSPAIYLHNTCFFNWGFEYRNDVPSTASGTYYPH